MQEGLTSGNLTKDSEEYRNLDTQIINLQKSLITTKTETYNLYKEILNVPNEVATEKINKITEAYLELSSAMSSGVLDGKSKQNATANLTKMMGIGDVSKYTKGLTYQGQNQALLDDLTKTGEELAVYARAAKDTQANLDAIRKDANSTEEDIRAAEGAANTAMQNLVNKRDEYSSKEVETVKQMASNIDAYYKSYIDWHGTIADQISTSRDYMIQTGSYMEHSGDIIDSYTDQIKENSYQIALTERDIDKLKETLEDGLASGAITEDSEEFRDLDGQIRTLEKSLISTKSEQQNLFKELVNVPNEVATEKIDKITKSYLALNAAMSAGVTDSQAKQRSYARLSNLTGYGNGEKYNQGPTFIGQNQALMDDLGKSEQELVVDYKAMKDAEANLEAVRNKANVSEGEIKSAQEAYDTAMENMMNKQSEYSSQEVDTAIKTVENIGAYYNAIISNLDTLASSYAKVRDVLDELGRKMDENGNLITDIEQISESYGNQIDTLTKKQKTLMQSIADQEAQMQLVKDTIGEDTQEYKDLESGLVSLRTEVMDCTISIDQLYDAQREAIYFKPIEEAIEKFQKLRSNLEAVNELIADTAKLTRDGEFTQLGKLSLTLDAASYSNTLKSIQKLQEEYTVEHQRWLEDETYSDEESLKKQQEIREQLLSEVNKAYSGRAAILDQLKNRYGEEVNYIKELISAYKEELAKKKELADYDKSLKKKNKSIALIEAEIRALKGLIKFGHSI